MADHHADPIDVLNMRYSKDNTARVVTMVAMAVVYLDNEGLERTIETAMSDVCVGRKSSASIRSGKMAKRFFNPRQGKDMVWLSLVEGGKSATPKPAGHPLAGSGVGSIV